VRWLALSIRPVRPAATEVGWCGILAASGKDTADRQSP